MSERARPKLLITRHDASDRVELSDGSKWRIWPGDIHRRAGSGPPTFALSIMLDAEKRPASIMDADICVS